MEILIDTSLFMDYNFIIDKYYPKGSKIREILIIHSKNVADKAKCFAEQFMKIHPEADIDIDFLYEAAMLHDVGIFMCDAPSIDCHGSHSYICHGMLGAELMRKEGFPQHALVCERHTGTGLTCCDIEKQNLPLPHKDFVPVSLEEKIICFADKFFSKTHPEQEKTVEQARRSLEKFGSETVEKFDEWCVFFGLNL